MKRSSRFHIFAAFMTFLVFSMPLLINAQQNRTAIGARAAAIQDARKDANKLLWGGGSFLLGMAGGCILGSVGVISASLHQPDPPAQRLIGKSPQYVEAYTKAYQSSIRRAQVRSATTGCIGGSIVAAGIAWGTYYYRSR